MGKRESYEPGTFSWADLATSDADAAKEFYGEILGWSFDDQPAGEGMVYSMGLLDDAPVGALSSSDQPPHWNSYVTVESADESAKKAGELGGQALGEAFDVFDAGRMAIIQDPQGAAVCVWEPKEHIGAAIVNQDGALCWNELWTSDVDAASEFYGELFGWSFSDMDGGYRVIKVGDRSNGGIMKLTDEMQHVPPNWNVYFGCGDLDERTSRAQGMGAQIVVPPSDMGEMRFSVLADPQGAPFSLYSGPYED
jgi:uncharacterized protein